jgi:hypothetical protein
MIFSHENTKQIQPGWSIQINSLWAWQRDRLLLETSESIIIFFGLWKSTAWRSIAQWFVFNIWLLILNTSYCSPTPTYWIYLLSWLIRDESDMVCVSTSQSQLAVSENERAFFAAVVLVRPLLPIGLNQRSQPLRVCRIFSFYKL